MPHERDEDFKGCSVEGVCGGAMAITRKDGDIEVQWLASVDSMNKVQLWVDRDAIH